MDETGGGIVLYRSSSNWVASNDISSVIDGGYAGIKVNDGASIVIVIITFRLGFKRVPYFFKKTYQPML